MLALKKNLKNGDNHLDLEAQQLLMLNQVP